MLYVIVNWLDYSMNDVIDQEFAWGIAVAEFNGRQNFFPANSVPVLQRSPLAIYSIGGFILCYQFCVKDLYTSETLVTIWISARRTIRSPVICIFDGRDSTFEAGTVGFAEKERFAVKKTLEDGLDNGRRIVEVLPVIYCFPRIGFEISWRDTSSGESGSSVYDYFSNERIEFEGADSDPDEVLARNELNAWKLGAGRLPALAMSSLHGAAVEFEEDPGPKGLWADYASYAREVIESRSTGSLAGEAGLDDQSEVEEISRVILGQSFGSEGGEFPFFAQISKSHCALASAQMILTYFAVAGDVSQQALEAPFGFAVTNTPHETQMVGYQTYLAAHGFTVGEDFTPTFQEIKQSIARRMPLKIAIARHARACCGFREAVLRRNDVEIRMNEVLIHDPYPPQVGSRTWEKAGSTTWINDISFT